MKRVDVESIRDVLRKRLKAKGINSHYQRQDDKDSYQGDKESCPSDSQRAIDNYKSSSNRQLQVSFTLHIQ